MEEAPLLREAQPIAAGGCIQLTDGHAMERLDVTGGRGAQSLEARQEDALVEMMDVDPWDDVWRR